MGGCSQQGALDQSHSLIDGLANGKYHRDLSNTPTDANAFTLSHGTYSSGCPVGIFRAKLTLTEGSQTIIYRPAKARLQCPMSIQINGQSIERMGIAGLNLGSDFTNPDVMASAFDKALADSKCDGSKTIRFTATFNLRGDPLNVYSELTCKNREIGIFEGKMVQISHLSLIGYGRSRNTKYEIIYATLSDGENIPVVLESQSGAVGISWPYENLTRLSP
jgi:hypothetical protein